MDFISLSQNEKQIILGGLLGDSYYKKDNKIIRFYHSDKQKEYLEWKYLMFYKNTNNICRKIFHRIIETDNKTYSGYGFELYGKRNTLDDLFSFLNKHLYSNDRRRKISMKYLNELSELGLAVWWMDDGSMCLSKGNRYGKLSTHCFNYEENILIQKYFKKKWDIDVSVCIEKEKYYFIRFNATAMRKLIKIIYKHVCEIPSMIYKIDLKYTNKGCIKDLKDIYEYIEEHKKHYNYGTLETTGGFMVT